MKYASKVFTQPTPSTEDLEHEFDWGDTFFVSMRVWTPPEVAQVDPLPLHLSNLTAISISESNQGIFDVKLEGEDLVLTLNASEPVDIDTTVDYVITHESSLDLELEQLKDQTITHEGDFDFMSPHRVTVDADIPTLTGSVVILAGTTSATVNIPTVDDGVFTGGLRAYKMCTLTLTATDNPSTLLHTQRLRSTALLSDVTPTPTLTGTIPLFCRMNVETNIEPLMGGDIQELFTLGVDTLANPNLSTVIIDDTPLESIVFRPVNVLAEDATDLTGGVVYYQSIIKPAHRS